MASKIKCIFWEREPPLLDDVDTRKAKAQPEANIVVVGHGAYFAALLGGKHLSNCEIGAIEA